MGADPSARHAEGRDVAGEADVLAPDELPDGLVVVDQQGHVSLFNREAGLITGLKPTEVLGEPAATVLPLYDAGGRDWWQCGNYHQVVPARTRHPERSLHLVDGTEVLVSGRCVRGDTGATIRLVLTLRSVEERQAHVRDQAELVSTVAHELRSPLTSVKGFTATLLTKWDRLTEKQRIFMLRTINADADRVTRLITELLDVSRIESGRLELRRQLVDLPARARSAIAGRVASGDEEDRFRLEIRGPLPEMWLDLDKIDQVLSNLTENGVRHGAGTVSITVEPCEEGAAVSVRDEGEGIPADEVSRVFRQFWRGERRGGTGLGLFIVKGLVEAHGGTISVGRAPTGGAEFRFTLPAGTPEFV